MDQLVLAGTPADHVRVAFTRAFDQHFFDTTNARLVLQQRRTLDDNAQTLEPLARHGGFDEVGLHVGGFGSGPRPSRSR